MLSTDDLRRLYAKLNAQDILLTTLLALVIKLADDPAVALDNLRTSAMELADQQQPHRDDPSQEFVRDGMVLTLQMVAAVFERVRQQQLPRSA